MYSDYFHTLSLLGGVEKVKKIEAKNKRINKKQQREIKAILSSLSRQQHHEYFVAFLKPHTQHYLCTIAYTFIHHSNKEKEIKSQKKKKK